MSGTSEAKELSLLSKVELRIALADSDAKLELVLKTYLVPLLLKCASEHLAVRNKVISICQHINARIKSLSIQLPVAALLSQFKAQDVPLMQHMDLLYAQQGIEQTPSSERLKLLSIILNGFAADSARSPTHGASLFNLFLKLLPSISLPLKGSKEDDELRETLGLSQQPEDAPYIAQISSLLILFTTSHRSPSIEPNSPTTCPGLTPKDYTFLTLGKVDTWDSSKEGGLNLAEVKIKLLYFLSSGAFKDDERFMAAFFASADVNSRISEPGDAILKRSLPKVSLDDKRIVERLYNLYFGNVEAPPVRPSLQIKIIGLLSRSKASSTFPGYVTQLVERGLSLSQSESSVSAGREAAKLREAIFSFMNWIGRIGSPSDLEVIAPSLVQRLRSYIEEQGWPNAMGGTQISRENTLRGLAYETLGTLAKASPKKVLLDPELELLHFLFRSLSEDASGGNISVSIEEALGAILNCFADNLTPAMGEKMRSLLQDQAQLEVQKESTIHQTFRIVRSSKYTATRYANRALPYNDLVARWINLLGLFNNKSEIIEEARRGLDPYWYRMLNPSSEGFPANSENHSIEISRYSFPGFQDAVLSFFNGSERGIRLNLNDISYEGRKVNATGPAVSFCRGLLVYQALSSSAKALQIDANYERRVDAALLTEESNRSIIHDFIKSLEVGSPRDQQALLAYTQAAFESIGLDNGKIGEEYGGHFAEMCTLLGDRTLSHVATEVEKLQESILSNRFHIRSVASSAFGVLGSHPVCTEEKIEWLLTSYLKRVDNWKRAIGAEINQVHGSTVALAHLFSRLHYRQRIQGGIVAHYTAYIGLILDILSGSTDNLLLDGSFSALEQLCLFGALSSGQIPNPYDSGTIIEKVGSKAKAGNERAITALSRYAMIYDEVGTLPQGEVEFLSEITKRMYDLHELRQPEVQFTVGEGLSCLAVGWSSKSLLSALDIQGLPPPMAKRHNTLELILDQVLDDAKSTKPSLKKASVIWLICLIQYCGHLPPVQKRLRQLQVTFKSFLSDRDDLIRETAARGLTLVHERGDKELKEDLVRDLVGTFTGTTANLSGTVTRDSELFAPGALPTGDGSVSTYQDIMSLASEVGDPSLVYKFMSLAANNAIWTSRAALANFGLGNILADSDVNGYLTQNPKLYSSLFRYRFDPNSNVRRSMNEIWTALVKDPNEIIEKYFSEIMEDLLRTILGKEWRMRQASCAAIADLVQGRALEKYEKYLNRIWTLSFKVLDDIKDSVRKAAMKLCQILSASLVRIVKTGSSSKRSENLLNKVMPFLQSQLEASAEDVQLFSLTTLLDLIKEAGSALRPFIPDLIERLLGMLSSLEPQAINYLHLNASKYNLTEEKIDAERLKSVRSSPMMEAIENCLDLLDQPTMERFIPRLENSIKQTVGMPSKVGCSRVLVSLSTRHNFLFKPYADQFLKSVERAVLDRNETISSSYATAAGYLARLASENATLAVAKFAERLYFEAEDEKHRIVSGEIVYAVAKYSPDRFAAVAVDFLPFVFVAKHDSSEPVKEIFESTWNENVGGSRAISLYLKEIVALAEKQLDSPRWVVKHTSALSIAEIASSSAGQLSVEDGEIIYRALEGAISGKTWEGKERVLEAFVDFRKRGKKLLDIKPEIDTEMKKIILRESKRNNVNYRRHALVSLGQFALSCEFDLFTDVHAIVSKLLHELLATSEEMDIDSTVSGEASSKSIAACIRLTLQIFLYLEPRAWNQAELKYANSKSITVANALLALHRSIRIPSPDLFKRISQSLELTRPANATGATVVQLAVCEGVQEVFGRLEQIITKGFFATVEAEEASQGYLELISELGDGVETFRMKRAVLLETHSGLMVRGGLQSEELAARKHQVKEAWLAMERASSIKAVLERV